MNLFERFNEIEKELFDKKIRGIQVWALIREDVYGKIVREKKDVGEANRNDKNQPLLDKLKSFFHIIINTVKYSLAKKERVDYMFLNHPRRKKEGGLFKDIYTDPIIDELESTYVVFERLFQLKHKRPAHSKNILYADIFDFWPRLVSLIWEPRLNTEELEPWLRLEKKIKLEFDVEASLVKKIKREYIRAKLTIWGLKKLLIKLKPKLIVEVVGYNRLCKHINIAAKELSIPTFELQHGYITRSQCPYNFPKEVNKVESFPDYIGTWSNYYKEKMNTPIPKENIFSCGFKYFNERSKALIGKDQQNVILFISQGTIGNKLSLLALDLAKISPFKIIYKLHPGEVQDAKTRYSDLYSAKNIEVDDDLSSDLYQRIYEAECVIGVYSTALVEAASLERNVIIVGLSGWEYFKELIEDTSFPMEYSEPNPVELLNCVTNSNKKQNKTHKPLIEDYDSSFLKIRK